MIVVDDGSTDYRARVFGSICDTRIKLIQQPNAGVSAALNVGISLSRSELVAFIDADDTWDARFLQIIVSLRDDHPGQNFTRLRIASGIRVGRHIMRGSHCPTAWEVACCSITFE